LQVVSEEIEDQTKQMAKDTIDTMDDAADGSSFLFLLVDGPPAKPPRTT